MKKEFIECETDTNTEIVCEECRHQIDSEDCDNCDGVLVELADYHRHWTVVCGDNGEQHFCSKECAEEYYKKEVQENE